MINLFFLTIQTLEAVASVTIPLSIRIKFQHENIINLDKLKNTFNKINIIDKYFLDEFNINNSFFKLYYYGSPKKLETELLKFGYQLENVQGYWEINLDD